MLLQKQKQTPYIGVFKIITGEEIIAKVTEDTETSVKLNNPLQMVMGQRGAQFAPYMMMAAPGKPIEISKVNILAQVEPAAELETQYESLTSGIALPQKSSIIAA